MSGKRILALDIETYCEVPIRHGTHRYAEEAEVMLVALALDDGPVEVWDTQDLPNWREVLQTTINDADRVVVHNSHFDRTVLRHRGVTIPADKITDTMVIALQHALPGGLGDLCDVLGVPQDKAKDKAGKKLIQLFCKPCPKNWKIRRATRETHPTEWAEFIEYARLDVDAMRDVLGRLPRWNCTAGERALWLIDQDINDRGFATDQVLAAAAKRAFARASGTLAARASALTGDEITSLTQTAKVREYIGGELGLELPDLTKGTIADALKSEDLDFETRELLELRQQAAATSPAKYDVILNAASSDGRLRGSIQFCGASRTGRDAGRLFQPQNLPRPTMDGEEIEAGILALKLACEDLLYDNVSELCANAVRGVIVAAPGKKLLVSDLSNIEGRVLAWLAGEFWKIEAFEDYDAGRGPDIYKLTAARILDKHHADVTKLERQNHGKVPELACLGPDTLVLTDNGVKAITLVTKEDKLWDGATWVTHRGLVERGLRQTITVCGVEMTQDHMLLAGETWLPAKMVVSSPSCLALALETGEASWSLWASTSARAAASAVSGCSAPAGNHRTTSTSVTGDAEPALAVTAAPSAPPENGARIGFATPMCAQTTLTVGASATASPPASIAATTQTTGGTPTTGAGASMYTRRGGEIERLFSATSSPSKGGTTPPSNSTELTSTGATNRATCVSSAGAPIAETNAPYETSSDASASLRPVFDIAHAGPRNRFTVLSDSGVLVVHNCGYQGSVGAFNTMGKAYGVSLPEERILEIVRAWRAKHPKTKSLWYDVEAAAKAAVRSPQESVKVRELTFDVKDGYLRMRLPSGRYLCYRNPQVGLECYKCEGSGQFYSPLAAEARICPNCGGSGREDELLRFEGIDQYSRKWKQLETYGGKLVENAVQAIARDVFLAGMRRAEEAGYHVVLRVHDELVCEVPDSPEYTVKALDGFLTARSPWNQGLPLAAAGHEMYRYAKGD